KMSEPPSLPPQSPPPNLVANGPPSVATAASDASSFDQSQQQQQQVSIEESDYDKCRIDYVDEIAHLEAEFSRLKSHLFDDRLAFLRAKEQEVLDGRAPEYLEPLAQLTENCRIRLQVAKLTRQLRTRSAKHYLECELQWAETQLEWDRKLLEERLRAQINQQISNHLAAGSRHQSGQLNHAGGKVRQSQHPQSLSHPASAAADSQCNESLASPTASSEQLPRPVTTSGPVIVYQLTEAEIMDDYQAIMLALSTSLTAPV
uniref:Breast cancer metastasis-suppressor 1-like protein n=1 Tax=Macrostomum lignano TaxID=282301 RepID=A0A1I8IJF1_9PLAT